MLTFRIIFVSNNRKSKHNKMNLLPGNRCLKGNVEIYVALCSTSTPVMEVYGFTVHRREYTSKKGTLIIGVGERGISATTTTTSGGQILKRMGRYA